MARKSKILGLDQIAKTKHRIMEFDGEWRKAFGRPAINGSWLIWGNSNQGKTRFALQLCKYLTNFGRVITTLAGNNDIHLLQTINV